MKKRPEWMDRCHEFRENRNDYSMCICGVPLEGHQVWEDRVAAAESTGARSRRDHFPPAIATEELFGTESTGETP